MSFTKVEYKDQETVITAENMNDIQDAILALEDGLFTVEDDRSGEVITITDASNRGFRSFNIYGKTTQAGTPTPDAPVDLVSVGDSGSTNITVAGKNIFKFVGKPQMDNGSVIDSTPTGGTFQGNPGDTPGSSLWTSGWAYFERASALHLKAGTIITISADYTVLEKHPSAYGMASIILDSLAGESSLGIRNAEIGVKYRISRTVVIPQDGKYKRTTFTTHSSKVEIENVQWEIGAIASGFSQYQEQTLSVSTPNGLPGIPVASSGNYTDSNGQQWICDEKNFARGVYIQRIGLKELTGTETYLDYISSVGGVSTYLTHLDNTPFICSHFIAGNTANWANAGAIVFKVAPTGSATLDEFVAFVSEQYKKGTPISVAYILATPVETPLTENEIAAYATLRTYKDHTTVLNDYSAYMALEYVMDAKKYIDGLATGTIVPATIE